ncbi:MAG: hypothetical protein AMJ46_06525 [Latescibacteria bacterium DG_63]|nr:MAG: hypothetical protein AMJ46_06525 [Latescibacteria bacterium DG_63]
MKCPFLEEVVVRYCKAYPIKKMIPEPRSDTPCVCLSSEHLQCSEYCSAAQTGEVNMEKESQAMSIGGDPSFFPPGYWRTCCVYACSVCPYRGICVAASAGERQVSVVRGFFLLRDLVYHRKHLWFKVRRDGTIRVGLDDFGRKLVGAVTDVSLPDEKGTVREGDDVWKVKTGKRTAVFVSPIDGEIVRTNRKLRENPSLVNEDPYGSWFVALKPFDLKKELSKMMDGTSAEAWLDREVDRLHHRVESELGMTVADGGELMIPGRIDEDDWRGLLREFLLVKE